MRFQGQIALVPVRKPAFVRVRKWDRSDFFVVVGGGGEEDDEDDDDDDDDTKSSNI